jgi:hypothetical protein
LHAHGRWGTRAADAVDPAPRRNPAGSIRLLNYDLHVRESPAARTIPDLAASRLRFSTRLIHDCVQYGSVGARARKAATAYDTVDTGRYRYT